MQSVITLLISLVALSQFVACVFRVMRRRRNVRDLSEMRIVIVGASSGIGRSLALRYAEHGCSLLLVARRQEELLKVQSECLEVTGSGAVYICVKDICQMTGCEGLKRALGENKFHKVDKLFICVGTLSTRVLSEYTTQELGEIVERVFSANLFGPVMLVRQLWSVILVSQTHVVVLSSAGGQIAAPTRSLYCSSKFALEGFIEAVRLESRATGVEWTIVCPGSVDTGLREKAFDRRAGDVVEEKHKVTSPVHSRMSADDCAAHIIHSLLSFDHPRFIYVPATYRLLVWLKWLYYTPLEHMLLAKYRFGMSKTL
jgi:short-subunit dehydrogenase